MRHELTTMPRLTRSTAGSLIYEYWYVLITILYHSDYYYYYLFFYCSQIGILLGSSMHVTICVTVCGTLQTMQELIWICDARIWRS